MKAWKRLLLLLSGASRLTWLYRVPKDRVLEPEDNPRREPGPGARPASVPSRPGPGPSPPLHLASPRPPPRSRGCSCAAR